MQVLSAYPNIEITCLDSCERFDDNKTFMVDRRNEESNPNVMDCLSKDIDYLDNIQIEMSTARQFMFSVRFKRKRMSRYSARSIRLKRLLPSKALRSSE